MLGLTRIHFEEQQELKDADENFIGASNCRLDKLTQ
jgi:hypothetical protein